MRLTTALITATALLSLAGCSKSKPGNPAASAPAPGGGLAGTVLEVIPAAPYTYLRVKAAQGEVWAAVPAADVKVGAEVNVNVQLKMDKFESPSLHRVFDTVYMGTLAGAAPAAPAPMAADAPDEKIEKAPGASTVAELFARKGQFKDGTVTVKGKVVKYNEAILGKNWLHLRDGSGTLAAKDNDITVTTKTPAKVGDVVTAKGVLRLDKDFGAGYVYTVMIEDASIVK